MKGLIKQFKKFSIYKKISFLAVLFLLIFLPIATIVALQPKDIKRSKAAEPEPTPTIMLKVTGIIGGGRAGTTTPCGGLNQRCCTSIPSCKTDTGQQLNCYSGFCRVVGTVTISPRPRSTGPMPTEGEDTKEVGVGYYKPTSTPTPSPTVTPTPVSSIWVP